jgi:HPt (histidine-containing phosphotransfer) domain-containing protein
MALHYNLAKVYAISEDDGDFVLQIATLFVSEIPPDLALLKEGINLKDYKLAYSYAHKIKPTLDLLGMSVAFEEILCIEDWTKKEGKRSEIKATYKDLESRIEKAVKEIKKDFSI